MTLCQLGVIRHTAQGLWVKGAFQSGHIMASTIQGIRFGHSVDTFVEQARQLFPTLNGVVAGTSNHTGYFPHITVTVEGGMIAKIDGGGYLGQRAAEPGHQAGQPRVDPGVGDRAAAHEPGRVRAPDHRHRTRGGGAAAAQPGPAGGLRRGLRVLRVGPGTTSGSLRSRTSVSRCRSGPSSGWPGSPRST